MHETNTPAAPNTPAERMTRKEAAEHLRVSVSFLAQDATTRRHGVPFYKAGRLVWYLRSELDAWMNAKKVVAVLAKSVPVGAECDVPSRPLTEQDVKMLAGREVLSARLLNEGAA